MNISKLKKGMVLKNYKELCGVLEIEAKKNNSKVAQIKELLRHCKYHKEGHKIVIDEIYNEVKNKIDGRGKSEGSRANVGIKKDFPNLLIEEKHENSNGVYIIQESNDVYIGSTIAGFRTRFQQHTYEGNNNPITRKMVLGNGFFKILYLANENDSEQFIREKEDELIRHYKDNTDYNVVNSMSNAWSCEKKYFNKDKRKYKYIKIEEKFFEKFEKVMKENNIDFYDIWNRNKNNEEDSILNNLEEII